MIRNTDFGSPYSCAVEVYIHPTAVFKIPDATNGREYAFIFANMIFVKKNC